MSTLSVSGKIKVFAKGLARLEKRVKEFPNVEKTYKESESYLKVALTELEKDFEVANGLDQDITADGDNEAVDVKNYFENDLYESYRTLFMKHSTTLLDLLKIMPHESSTGSAVNSTMRLGNVTFAGQSQTSSEFVNITNVSIPNITPFEGQYEQWEDFKDIYEDNVHHNLAYSDAQKLRLLKTFLKGPALKAIKRENEHLSASNYEQIWSTLCQRYNRKRSLINTHMKALFYQPKYDKENSENLQAIFDTTLNAVSSLKSLGLQPNNWDEMLLFLTVSKLPLKTREIWDQKIGRSDGYPKFKDFTEFLEDRFRILEDIEDDRKEDANIQSTNKYPRRKSAFVSTVDKSHSPDKSKQCKMCQHGSHPLKNCDAFKSLSIKDRVDFVKRSHLCYNCFAHSHRVGNCPSRYVCNSCGKKHHSMLHLHTNDPQPSTSSGYTSSLENVGSSANSSQST